MDMLYPVLSICMGFAGFMLAKTISKFANTRVPQDHAKYRDLILNRLHYLINLQAEIADVEQDLVELWEKAPDKQAHLLVSTVERARTIAPGLHTMAKRFGFQVPEVEAGPAVLAKDSAPQTTTPQEVNGWIGN